MSTTDRSQAYRGPCPCGAGEVIIQYCTPDHPWPTRSNWFEPKLTCENCNEAYVIEEQGQYFGLFDKREIIEREERSRAYSAAQKNLMATQQSQEVVKKFTEMLDSLPSMAACHRLLSARQLVLESYGTFIKRWKGATTWVKDNIRADQLNRLAAVVDLHEEYISTAVTDLERLWEESRRPLPFIGTTLFDTSSYNN